MGKNLQPYAPITYANTFELNDECFFAVALFIISESASIRTNVVDNNGTIKHIRYTKLIGVSNGGSAKQAQIVFIIARELPQHAQNCMLLHKPFENRRDNSINAKIDIESSRHTAIEQGIALS